MPAVTGAVKTFWSIVEVTGGAPVPNGVWTLTLTWPALSPRFVNQTLSFDCRNALASSARVEREAISCTPPMCPNAENDATVEPGMRRMLRSTSRIMASSFSPSDSGDAGTTTRSAIVRASRMSVARRGTRPGAGGGWGAFGCSGGAATGRGGNGGAAAGGGAFGRGAGPGDDEGAGGAVWTGELP